MPQRFIESIYQDTMTWEIIFSTKIWSFPRQSTANVKNRKWTSQQSRYTDGDLIMSNNCPLKLDDAISLTLAVYNHYNFRPMLTSFANSQRTLFDSPILATICSWSILYNSWRIELVNASIVERSIRFEKLHGKPCANNEIWNTASAAVNRQPRLMLIIYYHQPVHQSLKWAARKQQRFFTVVNGRWQVLLGAVGFVFESILRISWQHAYTIQSWYDRKCCSLFWKVNSQIRDITLELQR